MALKKWWRRIRAAVGMGVTWAVAWAPVGVLIGLVFGGNRATPDTFPLDDWMMPLAVLGFLGGTIFSGVLRIAEGRRRFAELSIARFAAWGALGGFALGGIAVVGWLLDPGWGTVFWSRAGIIVGATTIMSAGSASGSLALARKAETRESLAAGNQGAELVEGNGSDRSGSVLPTADPR